MATLHPALWAHCLDAARQIAVECKGRRVPRQGKASVEEVGTGGEPSDSRRQPVISSSTSTSLQGCGAALVDLLGRQATQILRLGQEDDSDATTTTTATSLIVRRLDDLVELAHARFYAYAPSDVPACWRHLYTDASILLFALRWRHWHCQQQQQQQGQHKSTLGKSSRLLSDMGALDGLVRPLDLALILAGGAGPAERGRAWIHAALDQLHCILEEEEGEVEGEAEGESRGPSPQSPTRKRPRLLADHDGPQGRQQRRQQQQQHHDFSAGPMFADHREDGGTTGLLAAAAASVVFTPPVRHPVPRSGPLGLEAFQAYLDRAKTRESREAAAGPQPLVMTGLLDHWPARQSAARPWSSPAYLRWRTLRGRRLVPVEVGRSYVDAGWTQAVVPFEHVLEELVSSSSSSSGGGKGGPMYLAQHALFTQMPWLQNDICIPDACYTTTSTAEDDEDDDVDGSVLINAWLGPPGTITPLHTDPHHNLLCQVVGRKYVRLYAPAQTAALRPRGRAAGGVVDMGNTSHVDVGAMEGWDGASEEEETGEANEETGAAKRFQDIPFVDCILEPGDTLYIPQGWWHYVRGLSVSFSVSFWWN